MILNSQRVRMIADAKLFDDVVRRAPCLHFATGGETIDRLMMRAVHALEARRCVTINTQWLDVVILLFGQIMTANIEPERAVEGDVEDLQSFADCEDR